MITKYQQTMIDLAARMGLKVVVCTPNFVDNKKLNGHNANLLIIDDFSSKNQEFYDTEFDKQSGFTSTVKVKDAAQQHYNNLVLNLFNLEE